jgi:hypothetical protein
VPKDARRDGSAEHGRSAMAKPPIGEVSLEIIEPLLPPPKPQRSG